MKPHRERRGFALMAALWLVVIVGATGYELSVRSRAQRLAVANSLEHVAATAAADAGLETARAMLEESWEVLSSRAPQLSSRAPQLSSRAKRGTCFCLIAADTLQLGDERAVLAAYDANARVNLNRASEDDLRRLFTALRIDAGTGDRMAQRILDWRDADESRRARGMERSDYLQAGARVMPADALFARMDELLDVGGITPELYRVIEPHLTLLGSGQVNANTASPVVLRSLPGVNDEVVAVITNAARGSRPIRTIFELTARLSPGALSVVNDASAELMQRLIFETREVAAVSVGWLAGSPVRVRAEALYTRTGDAVFVSSRTVGDQ